MNDNNKMAVERVVVVKDANIGNGPNTYWRSVSSLSGRQYAAFVDGVLLRNAAGKVRRFASRDAAMRAGISALGHHAVKGDCDLASSGLVKG